MTLLVSTCPYVPEMIFKEIMVCSLHRHDGQVVHIVYILGTRTFCLNTSFLDILMVSFECIMSRNPDWKLLLNEIIYFISHLIIHDLSTCCYSRISCSTEILVLISLSRR